MFLKILLSLIILIIMPTILGLLVRKFLNNEKNNLLIFFIIGYMIEFAICQLLAVPMIYSECTYKTLLYLFLLICMILSGISIKINKKYFNEIIKNSLKYIKDVPKILLLITIILIGIQVYGLVGYMHEDSDDATYVAAATTAVQTNSLFKYSAQTGSLTGEHVVARYRLGPFPVYLALISGLINIHPAIVAHNIIPLIFIPLAYMVYGVLANKIFKNDKKSGLLFICILCLLHIWGGYSKRTNFAFLLFRIWQGKAILANIIIPTIWLLFIMAEENNYKLGNCILLVITILGGILTTTMGIALPPIVLMSLCFAYEFPKLNIKKIKSNENIKVITNVFKCFVCCIPAIIYGILYFII